MVQQYEIIDVTNMPKVSDESRGVTEKDWIQFDDGRTALFKYTQIKNDGTLTNSHYSEKLASELAKIIGLECAEIDFATRDGRIGCVSYNFLGKGDELQAGDTLIHNIRPNFNSKALKDKTTKEKYSIPLILESVKCVVQSKENFEEIKKNVLKMIAYDLIIGNYDRNPTNWGIITNKYSDKIRMTPIFDNATSFGFSLPTEIAKMYYEENFSEFNEEVISKIGSPEKSRIKYVDLVDYLKTAYFKDTYEIMCEINKKLTPDVINDIVDKVCEGFDDYHKNLAKKLICERKEYMVLEFEKKNIELHKKRAGEKVSESGPNYARYSNGLSEHLPQMLKVIAIRGSHQRDLGVSINTCGYNLIVNRSQHRSNNLFSRRQFAMDGYFLLLWTDIDTGQKYCIGKMYGENNQYHFEYDKENLNKAKEAGFKNIIGFKDLDQKYSSTKLFQFFATRVPSRQRKDIESILQKHGLSEYNEVELLKVTKGKLFTDNFELEYISSM